MGRILKWAHVYRFYERIQPWLKQSVVHESSPRGERVVVLAPHIDDETIGCGGVMMRHVEAGGRVAILTFADCTPERIEEGRAAAKILGVQRQDFLGHRSKTLLTTPTPAQELQKFLEEERPEVVYVPSLVDRHSDHVAVNHMLANTGYGADADFVVYGYEVWSTVTPNVVVDITEQKARKEAALECFSSQNRSNNWTDAALSLNRYRGITCGAGQYAEAFFRLSRAHHRDWVRKIWG